MRKRRVLWLPRHEPQEKQIKELEKVFGGIEIVQVSKTVSGAMEVLKLMQENETDELVAVLPIGLIAELTEKGVHPLRAVMKRELNEEGEAIFTHEYFERVMRVDIISHPLEEEAKIWRDKRI